MSSSRQAVWAPDAPKPNANYSHAVISKAGTIYLAGWMGDDPATGKIVEGGIEAQTERAILNIKACLEAAGSSLDKVLTRRIYIIPLEDFRKVTAVWDRYFDEPYPVSTCIGVRKPV
ncbi:2-iminobutanoate/2-iminopropanoate deaminase [Aspergillus arachidicola]|uniref:2-iminobutanoate/2-iminopropanoate deaminase n=1 Tax=Aspergillus arachidicola TaxID=656916 RepID=A0A5N6XXA1_9EURO|nr:2-iminobutanoate/2-iminopropanoate deaminase [Aspergillus arachidicola]